MNDEHESYNPKQSLLESSLKLLTFYGLEVVTDLRNIQYQDYHLIYKGKDNQSYVVKIQRRKESDRGDEYNLICSDLVDDYHYGDGHKLRVLKVERGDVIFHVSTGRPKEFNDMNNLLGLINPEVAKVLVEQHNLYWALTFKTMPRGGRFA